MVGNTAVVQAYYNGRKVGRADVTVSTDRGRLGRLVKNDRHSTSRAPTRTRRSTTLIQSYASDPTTTRR